MDKLVIAFVLFVAAAGSAFAQATATKPPSKTPPAATAPSDQFTTEAAARAHCPGDTVVWATLSRTKAYHLSGDRYYGKTRRGAYMCQKDADKDGMHQVGRRSAASPSPGTTKSPSAPTH